MDRPTDRPSSPTTWYANASKNPINPINPTNPTNPMYPINSKNTMNPILLLINYQYTINKSLIFKKYYD